VSQSPFQSLNLSRHVGDDPKSVEENWAIWEERWGGERIEVVVAKQVHGCKVLRVDAKSREPEEGDALWTTAPDVVLGVLTADCVPILLWEPEQRIAAAVHAGWRGTAREVAVKTVQTLVQEGHASAGSLYAAIGPSIRDCCYEVGAEVLAAFPKRWQTVGWTTTSRGLRVNLSEINRLQLLEAGLPEERVSVIGPCTSCRVDVFFSYRRSGNPTGRQLSFVGWDSLAEPGKRT
jgi:hypothetical protein